MPAPGPHRPLKPSPPMPPHPAATAAAMKSPRVRMPPEPDTVIAAATFPLVFSDGERETSAGSLVVFSNTDLAGFKALLAKRLRGEPHRLAAFLVRRKRGKSSPGRKIPIDASTDFAALVRQRDCHVLALFRRSPPRRPRRPPKGGGGGGGGGMPDPPSAAAAAWERQLQMQMQQLQIQDQELEAREHELERERLARYPYLVGEARRRYTEAVGDVRRREAPPPVCGFCNASRAWGRKPEFHLCVHDQVVDNFRTVAGAIGPPSAMRFA